jgi:hypothetical protein
MFIVGCSSVSSEKDDIDIITVGGYSIEYKSQQLEIITEASVFEILKIVTTNNCHAQDYVEHYGRYTIKEFNQFDYVIDSDYRMVLKYSSLTDFNIEDFWITYTQVDDYNQESADIHFEYSIENKKIILKYPKESNIDFSQVEKQLIEQFAHCM